MSITKISAAFMLDVVTSIVPILLVLSTISVHAVYAQNANVLTKTVNVTSDGKSYLIKYGITNAKIKSIVADNTFKKIVVNIQPTGEGKLVIQLSRSLIDAKKLGSALDAPYTVRQNETHGIFGINLSTISNSRFNEILNNATSRTLAINFDEDVKEIEIIGTQMAK